MNIGINRCIKEKMDRWINAMDRWIDEWIYMCMNDGWMYRYM